MPARQRPESPRVDHRARAAALLEAFVGRQVAPAGVPFEPYRCDPVARLARWRARCGDSTPAQVRAWVLASLVEKVA